MLRAVAEALVSYVRIAWWGLVAPQVRERAPLRVVQGVIRGEAGVLLALREDLRGLELPGGTPEEGEPDELALRREIREETGLEVEITRHVGEYVRTGFRPHTAGVYLARVVGGELRCSAETLELSWVDPENPPPNLFPWYLAPLADALEERSEAVLRREHQGVAAILAGLRIDLCTRFRSRA